REERALPRRGPTRQRVKRQALANRMRIQHEQRSTRRLADQIPLRELANVPKARKITGRRSLVDPRTTLAEALRSGLEKRHGLLRARQEPIDGLRVERAL